MAQDLEVTVNGDAVRVPAGCSVAGLIERLELRPELVAVEVNGALVPRRERDGRALAAGDAVELVTLVGGG